jgi:hypothetical protein
VPDRRQSKALVRRYNYTPTVFHRFGPFNAISSFLDGGPLRRFTGFAVAVAALTWAWTLLNQGEYLPALVLVVLFTALAMLSLLGWEIRTVSDRGSRLIKSCAGITFLLIGIYSVAVIYRHKGDKAWSALLASPTPTPTPLSASELAKEIVKELPPPPPATKNPFREKSGDTVKFILGGNTVPVPRVFLFEKPYLIPFQGILGNPSFNAIGLSLKNDRPIVTVQMWGDGKGHFEIEVIDNQFALKPPDWERNFNDEAFEVIDNTGRPILQIYYKGENEIVVAGVFKDSQGKLFANETGIVIRPQGSEEPPPLKKMFRYPSDKYPGQLSAEWRPYY